MRCLTLKAILKYCNHPSIVAIKEKTKNISVFNFNLIKKDDVSKEDLDVSKASLENDISTKIFKE